MKPKKVIGRFFEGALAWIFIIVILPLLLLMLIGAIIYTPVDYIIFKRSAYQKDFPRKYKWLCGTHINNRLYTVIKENRLPITYLRDPDAYVFDEAWYREVESVSHREYATGFWYDDPRKEAQLCTENGYIREKAYFATVIERGNAPAGLAEENEQGVLCRFRQRNKLSLGDPAELLTPGKVGQGLTITELYDEEGTPIESAPHPLMTFWARLPFAAAEGDILRAGERENEETV